MSAATCCCCAAPIAGSGTFRRRGASGRGAGSRARRELREEIGLSDFTLRPAGITTGTFDCRPDRVHFFELRLDRLPHLSLDNREIVAARLFAPEELRGIGLTRPVLDYLAARGPANLGHAPQGA